MNVNVNTVVELLDDFSNVIGDNPPLLEDGNLDVSKLQLLPGTIEVISKLKEEGVTSQDHLAKLGLVAASLILKF